MNTRELLEDLHRRGIRVWTDGKILSYNAPPGVMTPELEAEVLLWNKRLIELLLHSPKKLTNTRPGRTQPLSFAQERLWFLEQLEPGTPVYNIPWAVRLSGDLKINALEQALDSIIARHEVLRTTYRAVDGVPQQVIHPATPVTMNVVDLRHLPLEERETNAQQRLDDVAHRPFDLTSDLMLRALLICLTDDEQILLLVAHHIASDGWSHEILVHELSDLYMALSHNEEPKLPPLPMQYADYALWQREHLTGEVLERELAYWKDQLADLPPALNLPFDRPRGPRPDYRGGRVPIEIPDQVTQGLRCLAREEKSTLFMVLLAGFMTLLYRYTGEEDIPIGIPIAGRLRTDTENLIGFFVSTLVLRGDLSQEPTFRQLLHRVRKVCLDAYDHQELPFEKLVAELHPERHMGQSPLFQVVFSLDNTPTTRIDLGPDVTARAVATNTGTADFDLALFMRQNENHLTGTLVYSLRLFNEDRMRDLAAHFVRLLEAGVMEPELAIGRMPMLSTSERKRIVVDWNAATAPEPEERTLHGLFECAASAAPQATAVVCGDDRLTYRDLNERSNHVAYYLRGLGVQADELVGISMHRSIDLIVGLLGILKAGGAYLPLDYRLPSARLRFMMEDAAVSVLLTQSDLEANLPTDGINVLRLDDDWPAIARLKPVPSTEIRPEDLAYVMYTSGSTGRPKGVMISHRNVVGFLNAHRHIAGTGPLRISTNVITYAFDVSVEEIFSPLCYGGTLHIVPYETTLDGRSLAHYLLDHGITTMNTVPDLLPSIAETFEKHGGCGDLSCLITGLTPKKQGLLQRFRGISSLLRILNVYGPTETTCAATAYEFESATDPERDVPIGKPFPDYQIYIVNDMLEPVPVGVTGEILIGGIGVSRGYLNQPGLTEERFIANPFSPKLSRFLYRSGDIGRYCGDGTIEFLGRGDRQVKIRGHRIELREIELVIENHPDVATCHANTVRFTEDDVRLVAYVVCTEDQQGDENVLRRHLQQQLPEYMIPGQFVFLDELPLTARGKVDHAALPRPTCSQRSLIEPFVAPRTPFEKAIAAIWKEILHVDRIGVHDDFFELGGNSLSLIRVAAAIDRELGARPSLRVLYEAPTVEGQSIALLRECDRLDGLEEAEDH